MRPDVPRPGRGVVTAEVLTSAPLESPEWHEARSRGLGGSEIAAVVGLSPWESPYALWQRKAGRIPPKWESPSMNWGKRLEPAIAQAFCEFHPEFGQSPGGMYWRTFQIASPDLLLTRDETPVAALEVKTADSFDRDRWGPSGSDEIPPYYRCQALWYLDVLRLPVAHLAVLIGGNDYREYVITESPREQAWLRWRGRKFWRSILENTPPPLDDSVHTYEAVRQLHPNITPDSAVEVDLDAYEQWANAAADLDRLKGVINLSRSRITEDMGDARYGLNFGTKVVRRQSTKGGAPYPVLIPQKDTA